MLTEKAEKILKRNAYDIAGHSNIMHGRIIAEVFGEQLESLTFDSFWEGNDYAVNRTKKKLEEEENRSMSFGTIVYSYIKKHPELTKRKENELVRELTRELVKDFSEKTGLVMR